MRYGAFLAPGGRIGFVAPSFGCATEPYATAFSHALSVFRRRGFALFLGENCCKQEGVGISAPPEACGEEFVRSFLDEGRGDVLISCGGGELMCEILDYVDFGRLAQAEPKWFLGYSDNTNLGFLLATLTDTASIYGPCAPAFGMDPWHESLEDVFLLLQGRKRRFTNYTHWEILSLKDENHPLASYNTTEPYAHRLYSPGEGEAEALVMEGRLVGGCLDCLLHLAGTSFDRLEEFAKRYAGEGLIWFLEACELGPFALRRALWKLRHCGWFDHARGFFFGRPMLFGRQSMGLDMEEAVLGALGDMGLPILLNGDIGHLPPMLPIIQGGLARIEACGNHLELEYLEGFARSGEA